MRWLCFLAPFTPLFIFSCATPSLPLDKSAWEISYLGNGSVFFSPSGKLLLSSGVPQSQELTHSALLLSRETLPETGFELEVEFTLLTQLRTLAPNPWETFWLFFSYQAEKEGKRTNYALVKTNGLEVGRAWAKLEQSFALTKEQPRVIPGETNTLRLLVSRSGKVQVFFQQKLVGELSHDALFRQPGRIGLYVEDARVAVRAVRVRILGR